MEINIVWGKSEGKTLISSFDKALIEAGIHNFNLIPLSSVIPQGATVRDVGTYKFFHNIGDILYVVISSFSREDYSLNPKVNIAVKSVRKRSVEG